MKRSKVLAPWLAILLVATLVRLPTLTAGFPYLNYVDEGHVLHHVVHHLDRGTWEPDTYSYPTLPFYIVTAAALAWSPVYAAVHGRALRDDLSPMPSIYYDIVLPTDLLILGRLITLAFSLGLVLLTGLYARRLAGPAAGFFAAWTAALLPALVVRSVIVNINPMVALFVLAAFYFAEEARDGDRPWRGAALAGVMVGLATVTKYPSALVCLPVTLAILLARRPFRDRLRQLFLAGGASLLAAVACMPALVLRTNDVLYSLGTMSSVYEHQGIGSYWDQAVLRAEWDLPLDHPELGLPFLILVAAGAVMALAERRWRKTALGWVLFAAATAVLLAPYNFRAFRNLLPLIPLAAVAAALLYARLREIVPQPHAADVAAVLLPLTLFYPALDQYIRHQATLVDTREQALEWIARNTGPKDRILVSAELTFLPTRLDTLEAETVVHRWDRALGRILKRRFNYVVVGELTARDGSRMIPVPVRDRILERYEPQAEFGTGVTHAARGAFRGNQLRIYVLKRKPLGRMTRTTRTSTD
ncbi:MAG TPA: glycosyltransferase family 39 protein [Thermoanaerobaculia bacterium]|nr:glycosyltransferase family 39 protein [Thermoanaerobaculia bacterium]